MLVRPNFPSSLGMWSFLTAENGAAGLILGVSYANYFKQILKPW
jgi:hypothetical protein